MKTLLGIFMVTLLLSGCSAGRVSKTAQNTTPLDTREAKEAFKDAPDNPSTDNLRIKKFGDIPLVILNPFKDDPDNPSPHNPLVKKFGDIPEVRTYIRLKQKLERGIGLNIDEAIELYTAEVHLYRTPAAKAALKQWKKDKERYERLGIPMGGTVMRYNIKADSSGEEPAATDQED